MEPRWRDIAGAEQVDGDVEILLNYQGLIVVRGRAFRDDAHRQAFLSAVLEHHGAEGERT